MNNSKKQLYTTGEFAQLCGVKKQTLFHYDDIGILRPVEKGENGYRLYSHEQYQDFLLISCLKEADMSLSEIKDYLEDQDEEHKEMVIQGHLAALDKRISYLMHVRKILASSFMAGKRAMGDESNNDDLIDIVERSEQRFFITPRLDYMDDKQLVEYVSKMVNNVQPVASCLSAKEVEAGNFDSPQVFLIEANKSITPELIKELNLKEYVRPQGRYGITYQQPGEEASDVYERLKVSMADFGEYPGEYFYEELMSENASGQFAPLIVSVQLNLLKAKD